MRIRRFVAVFIAMLMMFTVVLPSSVYATEIGTDSLTIQEALDIAYKKNPDVRKAELTLESAQISRDKAAEYIDYLPVAGLVDTTTYQVVNSYQIAQINLDTAKKNQQQISNNVGYSVINAYTQVIKNRNNMESVLLSLENMKSQQKVISLSKAIGLTADLDYGQFLTSLKRTEQSYKDAQLNYTGSIAALASLLGQNEDWKPQLSSHCLLETYPREDLSLELSRAISTSVLVMQQDAQLEIEKSKKNWILPNLTSESQNINIGMAEVDYEQARNSARSQLEQLYYNIEAIEGQIQAGMIACEQDQQDLDIAKLKYELGLIPRVSAGTNESLEAAEITSKQNILVLDSSKASLAAMKAQYAYLTGQNIYDAEDWEG